ncbi:MAG: hypothetical protein Q4G47_08015, partial [Lachnospiraceae bacterium]|nr:hypothetical protein [Lachnospiraceae bacterium]
GETSPDTDTGSGEDKDAKSSLAVPNVSEAKRTQSILAEMSKEAKGEDSSRLRGVVTAGVPDVVAWAAENSGGKSKRSR